MSLHTTFRGIYTLWVDLDSIVMITDKDQSTGLHTVMHRFRAQHCTALFAGLRPNYRFVWLFLGFNECISIFGLVCQQ